jgi:hypothetical protein
MSIFTPTWRIVTDKYCGYEVQVRRWWWPFWICHGFANTHTNIEAAERYALKSAKQHRLHRQNIVKELGKL